jgi:uncharacterized NAD-dependent epimerase/dehydratase family protein
MTAALEAAALTNPEVRCLGFSLDTSRLEEGAARDLLDRLEDEEGLPAIDPLRFGTTPLVDALVERMGRGV